jgi:hypothetical protein
VGGFGVGDVDDLVDCVDGRFGLVAVGDAFDGDAACG